MFPRGQAHDGKIGPDPFWVRHLGERTFGHLCGREHRKEIALLQRGGLDLPEEGLRAERFSDGLIERFFKGQRTLAHHSIDEFFDVWVEGHSRSHGTTLSGSHHCISFVMQSSPRGLTVVH